MPANQVGRPVVMGMAGFGDFRNALFIVRRERPQNGAARRIGDGRHGRGRCRAKHFARFRAAIRSDHDAIAAAISVTQRRRKLAIAAHRPVADEVRRGRSFVGRHHNVLILAKIGHSCNSTMSFSFNTCSRPTV